MMVQRRSVWGVALAAAVLLAGCGGGDLEVEDRTSLEEEEDPAPDDEAAEADDDGSDVEVDETEPGDGSSDEAHDGSEDTTVEEDLVACDLATTQPVIELDQEEYERAMLDANFELEILVMDLAGVLDSFLAGATADETYADELRARRASWVEITDPVRGLAPPSAAEPWHDRAIGSFDRVCEALDDGLAGVEEGDDLRADAHVEAIQGFPSLLNELHANAACGPAESC